MAKIKPAKKYGATQTPFIDNTWVCDCKNGVRKGKTCLACGGSGIVALKWVTETSPKNKVLSFTITHNGKPKTFTVKKGNILAAFNQAEKYFEKLPL